MPVYLLIGTCKKTVFQEYRVANDMHVKVIHADEVHTKSPKAEGFRQRVRYNVTVRFFSHICKTHVKCLRRLWFAYPDQKRSVLQ